MGVWHPTKFDASERPGKALPARIALGLVQTRLAAERSGRTTLADAASLACELVRDEGLCQLLTEATLQRAAEAVTAGGREFASLSDLKRAVGCAIEPQVTPLQPPEPPLPSAKASLAALRRWLSYRFGGSTNSAMQAARSFSIFPSGPLDPPFSCEEWVDFLRSRGWHGRSEVALRAFDEADFRVDGLVPAAELLFESVCSCRRRICCRFGSPEAARERLEVCLARRTVRQQEAAVVNAEQWRYFLTRSGWRLADREAQAVFDAFDVNGSGEVRIAELLGLRHDCQG